MVDLNFIPFHVATIVRIGEHSGTFQIAATDSTSTIKGEMKRNPETQIENYSNCRTLLPTQAINAYYRRKSVKSDRYQILRGLTAKYFHGRRNSGTAHCNDVSHGKKAPMPMNRINGSQK
jgi:hypothetical protein